MVTVAQLVEPRTVTPVVVGSSPISHPNTFNDLRSVPYAVFKEMEISFVRKKIDQLELIW